MTVSTRLLRRLNHHLPRTLSSSSSKSLMSSSYAPVRGDIGGDRTASRTRNTGRGKQATKQPNTKRCSSGTASRRPAAKKPVQVYSSDFPALAADCKAARYKVHRPCCECSKVKRLLSEGELVFHQGADEEETALPEVSTPEQPINGLIVMPDVKNRVGSLYCCLNTQEEVYDANSLETELKLRSELFPDLQEEGTTDRVIGSYKVSCAACLLEHQPNGFACVMSANQGSVNRARDWARAAAEEKESLHADHAHHVVTVPRSALTRLQQSNTRSQVDQARDELAQHLTNQGVPIQPEATQVVLKHHLKSLLQLTKADEMEQYWLVMVIDDTGKQNPCWNLDLPGGKRHLGETALQAAIRETEEETSLVWDQRWITNELQSQRHRVNRLFVLSPPDDDLAEYA